MSVSFPAQRILLLLLAFACALLIGWSGIQASGLLVQARTGQLYDAERAIAQTTASLIRQDRIPNRLVLAVQTLVSDDALNLDFITLRNAANVTLVSRGRLGEKGLAWLPGDSRAWRSWVYRTRSAEANRPILRDARRLGYAHFGVPWTGVVARAGLPLFIWATALLAGLIGLFGVIMRLSAPADAVEAVRPARPAAPAPIARAAAGADRSRAPLSRFARRGRDTDSGFAPIGGERPRPLAAEPAPTPAQPLSSIGAEPPAVPTAAAEPESSRAKRPVPPAVPPVAPVAPVAPEPAHEAVVVPPSLRASPPPEPRPEGAGTANVTAAPASTPRPEAEPPAPGVIDVAFEAPRVDARPTLGDTTLDLRFYPIWRGDAREGVLAGACAALAWRAGASELVEAGTLTQLAEKDGALRAYTQWIARRFSLLHGNWRTLELNTVPIVLPIPSAMLAFADAEAVWRDALRRTDRDPNDLILRLDSPRASAAHTTLPLRRARPAEPPLGGVAGQAPEDCDVLCVTPQQVNGDARDWLTRFDALDCPVLFGPVADPDQHPEILAHERVLWFSDRLEDVHSPRSFARLLARNRTAPI